MNKEAKKFLRRKLAWLSLRLCLSLSPKSLSCIYSFGRNLGKLSYLFAGRHRKIALQSVAVAFPEVKPAQKTRIVKDSFIFMCQATLEMFYFLKNRAALDNIRIEGKEYLDQAMKSNKGIVGFSAHLGNFPLMSFKLAAAGYPVNVLVRPMRDSQAGEYIQKLRDSAGLKTILSYPRKECVNDTIKALRSGEIVLIQMDQNFGTGGVWVKFFDKLAATPVGPIIFALRTQALLLPVYTIVEGTGKHVIKISPPVELEILPDKDETVLLAAIKLTKIIEGWVKENPNQWGWIHRRWKSRPSKHIKAGRFKVQRD
jgi:KDO2-lipid IV(A) lauroyltransferase